MQPVHNVNTMSAHVKGRRHAVCRSIRRRAAPRIKSGKRFMAGQSFGLVSPLGVGRMRRWHGILEFYPRHADLANEGLRDQEERGI
jgi:hypothetical protein